MNDRTPKRLDQLGSVARGKSRHRPRNDRALYGGRWPFFQTGDVKAAELYLHSFSQTYNDVGLAQSKLWPAGTLCITIAANIADTAILGIPGCFPDSVVGFVADPAQSDARFVKYYIETLKQGMQNASRGTTQDNLSVDKLLTFDFLVPPAARQREIASILSAYDDLIENNRRRIAILEEMARRIYEEWFVRFRYPGHESVRMVESELGLVPEGWRLTALGLLAEVNARSVRRGAEPTEIQYVDISSVSTGSIDNKERMLFADAPGRARRIVRDGDVIWASVRPNRKSYALVVDPEPNLLVSTGFAVLSPVAAPSSFIYQCVTTDDFVSHLVNHAKGAAYPAVGAEDFENAKVLKPANDLVKAFDRIAEPMMRVVAVLQVKNANLRATRDLLLPKLISGDLDVSAVPEPEALAA
ncbi:MAG: restriction endonuclease subunit S [Pseudomonadota bacterium]